MGLVTKADLSGMVWNSSVQSVEQAARIQVTTQSDANTPYSLHAFCLSATLSAKYRRR